jgi:hypothetical protein
MTREDAIETARRSADHHSWQWHDPVFAVRRRRWLVGKRVWHIRSNAEALGANAYFVIDDSTGAVIEARWLPR